MYIYNTTDERLTWEVSLPNGDTQSGEVKENVGYGPVQTTIPSPSGVTTTFRIKSESGNSGVEVKGSYSQFFVLAIVDGSMRVIPGGWTLASYPEKREIAILNVTGQPQTFDLIDEKEVRKGLTLQPGEKQTYPAKNGFGGSNGTHTLRFSDGKRLENAIGVGDFAIMFLDKRSPGQVQVKAFGNVTRPK
jgi:hypothetical protein